MEPVREEGAPEGTTIRVADLFYNTPARLKFMKKDSAETAAVAGLMQHLALSHPDVSFKFIKDGQESLHTPGDGKLESAVYAALGREFAKTLVPVQGRGGDIEVRGFVTAPVNGRGSRSMQVFFVNGRFIKSQLLTTALEEGYRNQLLKAGGRDRRSEGARREIRQTPQGAAGGIRRSQSALGARRAVRAGGRKTAGRHPPELFALGSG